MIEKCWEGKDYQSIEERSSVSTTKLFSWAGAATITQQCPFSTTHTYRKKSGGSAPNASLCQMQVLAWESEYPNLSWRSNINWRLNEYWMLLSISLNYILWKMIEKLRQKHQTTSQKCWSALGDDALFCWAATSFSDNTRLQGQHILGSFHHQCPGQHPHLRLPIAIAGVRRFGMNNYNVLHLLHLLCRNFFGPKILCGSLWICVARNIKKYLLYLAVELNCCYMHWKSLNFAGQLCWTAMPLPKWIKFQLDSNDNKWHQNTSNIFKYSEYSTLAFLVSL